MFYLTVFNSLLETLCTQSASYGVTILLYSFFNNTTVKKYLLKLQFVLLVEYFMLLNLIELCICAVSFSLSLNYLFNWFCRNISSGCFDSSVSVTISKECIASVCYFPCPSIVFTSLQIHYQVGNKKIGLSYQLCLLCGQYFSGVRHLFLTILSDICCSFINAILQFIISDFIIVCHYYTLYWF